MHIFSFLVLRNMMNEYRSAIEENKLNISTATPQVAHNQLLELSISVRGCHVGNIYKISVYFFLVRFPLIV